ncbi:MAG: 30S ribosomal protein S6 [Candidatus Kerfeldbacteria bacterium]|nr:30S ribosomal protein S6 [Candidatus Kerfeldbacteria bacterium]
MNHYEIMYIVPLKAGAEETSTAQDKVRAMLQSEGAKITLEDAMGKKKLAYPIEHVRHGSYVVLECDLEPGKIKKVSDWFRLSSEILRAQIVAKKLKTPEQLAREKAFQEKLARLHAQTAAEAKPEPEVIAETEAKRTDKPKIKLDELDKKLEQILEEEVK